MKKLEKFLLCAATLFTVITITLWVIAVLWETPNEGIIHNLFRISALGSVVSLGLYYMHFVYTITKK
jgi:hypothetical protein